MPAVITSALVAVFVAVIVGNLVMIRRLRMLAREANMAMPMAIDVSRSDERDSEILRYSLGVVRDGIVVVGSDGHVAFANDQAQRILDSDDRTLSARLASAGKNAASGVEFPKQLTESVVLGRTFEISAAPARPGDGVVLIVDRTDQLRLDAMRTDFVANASHELKTPLGAVSLLAETIAQASDPAMRSRLSTQLQQETKRLALVVDDILELADAEAGSPDRQPVSVSDIVNAALDLTFEQVPGAEGAVVLGEVVDATVVVNRTQVVSALHNLVANGVVHAFPSGEPGQVAISAEETDGVIEFRVGDDGVGIAPQHLDRLFERFFRVDRARSRASGGTGLGLSIVRHVALAHGGDVGVESQVGVGSTFWMRIPRAAAP